MSRRMMRYVMPAGDTELEIDFFGGDNVFVTSSPEGNIYIYVEEIDEFDPNRMPSDGPEHAIIRVFESGEAVDGAYLGSIADGKNAKHVYWVNVWEAEKYATVRGDVRGSNDVPEVQASGGSDDRNGASGSGEDV